MSENVISHQDAHGKRERVRSWPIRSIGAIVATHWRAPELALRPAASAPDPVWLASQFAPPVAGPDTSSQARV